MPERLLYHPESREAAWSIPLPKATVTEAALQVLKRCF